MPDLEPLPPGTRTGWYPDPAGQKKARYWDGFAWSSSVSNDVAVQPLPAAEDAPAQYVALDGPRSGAADAAAGPWTRVVVTTSHELPGVEIVEHVGEVFGITVRSRNFVSNFGAQLRNVVGGEVGGYTKMLTEARNEALVRLRQAAFERGADSVISMRMSANQISDLMTELVAYGTAVKTSQPPAEDPGRP